MCSVSCALQAYLFIEVTARSCGKGPPLEYIDPVTGHGASGTGRRASRETVAETTRTLYIVCIWCLLHFAMNVLFPNEMSCGTYV